MTLRQAIRNTINDLRIGVAYCLITFAFRLAPEARAEMVDTIAREVRRQVERDRRRRVG